MIVAGMCLRKRETRERTTKQGSSILCKLGPLVCRRPTPPVCGHLMGCTEGRLRRQHQGASRRPMRTVVPRQLLEITDQWQRHRRLSAHPERRGACQRQVVCRHLATGCQVRQVICNSSNSHMGRQQHRVVSLQEEEDYRGLSPSLPTISGSPDPRCGLRPQEHHLDHHLPRPQAMPSVAVQDQDQAHLATFLSLLVRGLHL